jgi:cob(I)alamin adenosyltransferase
VDAIEKELPPIKSFFISGGTELAALFDVSRTMARRAERRVIKALEEESVKIGAPTSAFLNRLSSLLYALARLSNHKSGIKESAPTY